MEIPKYKATIYDQELRGNPGKGETDRFIASIALKPPLVVYDNQDLGDILLGPNQTGVHVAPIAADSEATYFRATSEREEGYKDIEMIRVRIEEFANNPGSAILNLPPSDYFPR